MYSAGTLAGIFSRYESRGDSTRGPLIEIGRCLKNDIADTNCLAEFI